MSKRSYRRLAVVAGAALALGSVAPAMAFRVGGDADGTAGVSVETVDVGHILGGVQSSPLPTASVLNTVGIIRNTAVSTAFLTLGDVQNIVGDAVGGATCVVGTGTSAVLGLGAGALATAGVGVGLGGVQVGLGLDALVGAPVALVGDVTECLGGIQGHVLTTVGHAQAAVGTVSQLATTTAFSAVGSVQTLPGAVLGMATPLLLQDLLSVNGSAGVQGLVSFL